MFLCSTTLYGSSGIALAVSLVNARPATLDALLERCDEAGVDLAEVAHSPNDLA